MSLTLRLHDNEVFNEKFREKQNELTEHAQSSRSGFNEKTAEIIQMQQQEILRLQKILRDTTLIPERHAVSMTVSSIADKNGLTRHNLVATASDRSVWLMPDFSPAAASTGRRYPGVNQWVRLPVLPQAADEAEAQ